MENGESGEPRSFFLDVNGIRLSCQDWGGGGPPIVILHATGFLGRVYRPIALALRSTGHVYSYDQRGHGDSSRPADGDYSWAGTTADLKAFIVSMKLEGARGLGHSAGATAIGSLAGAEPALISHAVLVEPVVFDDEVPESAQDSLYERTRKRKRWFESAEAMFRNLERKPPFNTWRHDMLHDYCEYGTRPAPQGGVELKCPPEIEAEFYSRAREFPGLTLMLKSRSPLLLMFGEKSDSTGAKIVDKIAAQLANGTVVTIPGASHFLPMEQPEIVARTTAEFFNRR
ncbi:MAG: alpha/beta hydrolase [Candidatus Binataceae bacterium]